MDFLSGMLMRFGLPLAPAFIIPSIIFSFILIFSMYTLFYLVSNSKAASILAINIFFFSSGLGFINFIYDFIHSFNLDLFFHPIKQYSQFNNYDWYTGNVIVGLIIPQRSFLMGLSLGILSLSFLIFVLQKTDLKEKYQKAMLVTSGVIAGFLPIIHPHSFIALVIIGGLLTVVNLKRIKELLFFVVPAGVISSIFYFIFIKGGIQTSSFVTFLPGWTSKGLLDFLYMWALLWGLIIPLSIVGLYLIFKKSTPTLKAFFLSFFIIFMLGNLILFQPVTWDNTKIFWWAYIGFGILSSIVIVRIFKKNVFYKTMSIIIFISLIFTGILEINNFLNFDKNTYLLTPTSDINLGIKIRNSTNPLDIFVTASQHNTLVMVWAARPILLGYTAWVWNFGFNYQQRESDVDKIFLGGEESKILLKKYNVKYLLIGPTEFSDLHANEAYFQNNYPLAFSNDNNRIYKIK